LSLIYELGFDELKTNQRQEVFMLGIQCLMLIASCITISSKPAKGRYQPQSGNGMKFINFKPEPSKSKPQNKMIEVRPGIWQEFSKLPVRYQAESDLTD